MEGGDASVPVYFGNGCFWGRQKGFVDTEMKMGRSMDSVSSIVGYAGGRGGADGRGDNGQVCYYYSAPGTQYERLGHAEVVQVKVAADPAKQKEEYRMFAREYFSRFTKTPVGMIRLDPQDRGAGYRNVIGLPGGLANPLAAVLREENVNGMELVEGRGNAYEGLFGGAKEDDEVNKVYVMDTNKFPFFQ